jgi:hypothetical protein
MLRTRASLPWLKAPVYARCAGSARLETDAVLVDRAQLVDDDLAVLAFEVGLQSK